MTDEELATIGETVKESHEFAACACGFHTDYQRDVPALLSEVKRLRAENAALREIAQAVADNSYANMTDLRESARALLGDGDK